MPSRQDGLLVVSSFFSSKIRHYEYLWSSCTAALQLCCTCMQLHKGHKGGTAKALMTEHSLSGFSPSMDLF